MTKIDAIRLMKCGPESLWDILRGAAKMSAQDAYYRVVDRYTRDALFKGYTYPDVSHVSVEHMGSRFFEKNAHILQSEGKYISEEYLRGRPMAVTAASSAEDDEEMPAASMQDVQPRRAPSVDQDKSIPKASIFRAH